MASFTDQITQFTPYVQQLPVEEMTKVGMYKQAQYDQGVQKIQGYIDNIAGMDVVNDADKAYLQSKLNQLGSRLKTVAAADFSNQQLVNSVGGMATQVIKDPIVQNAVSSTAWYRKQLSDMEKAIQEGKASQANIYDFQKQSNEWLSSGKAGQVFRGRYTPYVDVDKKVLEVIKTLHPNATSEDIAYITEQAKDPKTGKIVSVEKIAAAMARKGLEGVSEAQISNAINATLDPNDLNQLRLNANYQFRGYDATSLQEYAKRKAANQVSSIDSTIKSLEDVANQYSSDSVVATQALDSIEKLKKKKESIELGLPGELDEIAKDPENLKYKIYKDGFVDTFANAFSWEKRTTELLSNPVLAADHFEREDAIRRANLQLEQEKNKWNQKMDMLKYNLSLDEFNLKLENARGGVGAFTTYGGENTNIDNPLVAMQKSINGKLTSYNNTVKDLASSLFGSANPANIGKAEAAIETYRNAGNDQERNAIPKEWRNLVDQAIANKVSAANEQDALVRSEKKIMADPALAGSAAAIQQSLKGKGGVTINIGGKPTNFTSEEIYNYLKKEEAPVSTTVTASGIPMTGTKGLTIDESLLSPKEKILHAIMKDVRYAGKIPVKMNATQQTVANIFKNYDDVMKSGRQFEEKKKQLVGADILSKSGKYIPALSPIFLGSEKEGSTARSRMESIANTVLSRYTMDKAGAAGLDVSGARAMLAGENKNSIQFQRLVQGDKTFLVMNLGNTEHVIPLTDIEAAGLPKSKDEKTSIDVDITNLQRLNGGVTNATGNPLNGYFQRVNFSNVKRFNVTADLKADKAAPSIQYMNINVKLPSGWKYLPLTDFPMDANQAASQISSMTDEDIIQLFLNSKNVPQSWKDEIKNLY